MTRRTRTLTAYVVVTDSADGYIPERVVGRVGGASHGPKRTRCNESTAPVGPRSEARESGIAPRLVPEASGTDRCGDPGPSGR